MSRYTFEVQEALKHAWYREAAEANLDRWLTICEKEGWHDCPQNLSLLVSVFGASWYFSRFIFFCGDKAAAIIDDTTLTDFTLDALLNLLNTSRTGDSIETQMDNLRLVKNEVMLQILLCVLDGKLSQSEIEQSLTNLAESCLRVCIEIIADEIDSREWDYISIVAMGRMAGGEMNFGSDLDLIFLYPEKYRDNAAGMVRQAQNLLRHISQLSPNGTLYEIDMRLRPHGSSGTLVTSVDYFIEYHSGEREVWERQMMTRCRSVYDTSHIAEKSLLDIQKYIYAVYDQDILRKEIIEMRRLVQKELGNPTGKLEIKRGVGGIMDIDFISHYLQLCHGHEYPQLCTASTRKAFSELSNLGLLNVDQANDLIDAYDFLKQIEGRLRIYDMKSVSAFTKDPAGIVNLARSMGFIDEDSIKAAKEFLDKYHNITTSVRGHFHELVGEF